MKTIRQKKYLAKYKKDKVANGFCYICLKPRTPKSRRFCARCLFISRMNQIERYRRFRIEGKCIRCQQPVSKTNKLYCEFHRLRNVDRMLKYHEKKRARGSTG